MNISINFTIPDPLQLLVYIGIGIVVALVVGGLARMRSSLGYIATVIIAAVGAWVFASILSIGVAGDVALQGVPLIEATLGGLLFGLVSVLLFARRRADVVVYDD